MAKKGKYYQRQDGLFETIRTINGKRVAFRGKTCKEVDRRILEYQEQKEKGRTVKELADEWEQQKEARAAEATKVAYKAPLDRLREALGEMYVSDVKPIQCQRMLDQMADRGNKLGTVKLQKTILRQVFRYAVIHGDIDVSPAAEIEVPRGLNRVKRNSLTPEQITEVLECREGDWWLLGLAFLLTGCRRGELLALRYEDVDRKNKCISINKKFSYATGHPVLETNLKTEAGERTIVLLPALAEALPQNRIGLIFHNGNGEPLEPFQIAKAWKEYQETVCLPEYITPHWMRHTFATICRDAGVDIKTTAGYLGHASESITAEIYTHQTEKNERKDAAKLEQFVAAL